MSKFQQWLSMCMPFLDKVDLATVTHALVNYGLDYRHMFYLGLPLRTVWKLQLVQDITACILTGVSELYHMIPILNGLQWLPVFFYVQIKLSLITYKAFYGLCSGYLKEHPP